MRLKVRKQTYYTDCEHANPRQCHAINTSASHTGEHWQHRYHQWHLEGQDGPTDDGPFRSAAEARAFRDGLPANLT
jgi:hypothetical protein